MNYKRILELQLPEGKSIFLWGPRKTGKSYYLKQRFPKSIVYDFLQTDTFFQLSKNPSLMREQLLAHPPADVQGPIILDEIQKVPSLLDEVQWLIENKKWRFILCGSSARKLKRGHANLLGGRAWRAELFPLTSREIPDFQLLRALNHGLIPSHYLENPNDARLSLKAYLQDYLKEEVFAEGLARNAPAFSRFLDAVGYGHGELVNYANISRDCGVDAKTVKEYYQILADTLLGFFVEPYKKRQSRDVISKAPKFYLFDTGIAGALCKRWLEEPRGDLFGKAFEHFILMEIRAYRSYKNCDFDICFWRTKTGLETDLILGNGEIAIEIKSTPRLDSKDLRGIKAFMETNHPRSAYVVSNETTPRLTNSIKILPWKQFLSELWSGSIIQ